jgi:hypothetical protein
MDERSPIGTKATEFNACKFRAEIDHQVDDALMKIWSARSSLGVRPILIQQSLLVDLALFSSKDFTSTGQLSCLSSNHRQTQPLQQIN